MGNILFILQHSGYEKSPCLEQGLTENDTRENGMLRVVSLKDVKVFRDGFLGHHGALFVTDNSVNPEKGGPMRDQGRDTWVNIHASLQSSVDFEYGAGDVGCLRSGQKQDCLCHLFSGAEAAHGHHVFVGSQLFSAQVVEELGCNKSR